MFYINKWKGTTKEFMESEAEMRLMRIFEGFWREVLRMWLQSCIHQGLLWGEDPAVRRWRSSDAYWGQRRARLSVISIQICRIRCSESGALQEWKLVLFSARPWSLRGQIQINELEQAVHMECWWYRDRRDCASTPALPFCPGNAEQPSAFYFHAASGWLSFEHASFGTVLCRAAGATPDMKINTNHLFNTWNQCDDTGDCL